MNIRDATHRDLLPIVELCLEALAQAHYKDLPVALADAKQVILFCISSPTQFCQVVEIDGELQGVLIGMADKVWWSTKKQASDLVLYVRPCATGAGSRLARRFIRWANKQKAVALIGMSISLGGTGTKRTGKLLERLGLQNVGSLHMMVKHPGLT
jgi:hypothetical protein